MSQALSGASSGLQTPSKQTSRASQGSQGSPIVLPESPSPSSDSAPRGAGLGGDDSDSSEEGFDAMLGVQIVKVKGSSRVDLGTIVVTVCSTMDLSDFHAAVYGKVSASYKVDRASSPLYVRIKGDVVFRKPVQLDQAAYGGFWKTVAKLKEKKVEVIVEVSGTPARAESDDDDSSTSNDGTPLTTPKKKRKTAKQAAPEGQQMTPTEVKMEDLAKRYTCNDDECQNQGNLCLLRKGIHFPLTREQHRRWAAALAYDTPGVTMDRPPNDIVFDKKRTRDSSQSAPSTSSSSDEPSMRDFFKLAMASFIGGARQQQQAPIVCMPMPAPPAHSPAAAVPGLSASSAATTSSIPDMPIDTFFKANPELPQEIVDAIVKQRIRRTSILQIALTDPEHRQRLGLELGDIIELQAALQSMAGAQ